MFWCIIILVLLIAFKKEVFEGIEKLKNVSGKDKIWLGIVLFLFLICCIWLDAKIGNNKNSSPEKTETVASIKSEAKSDVEVKELSAETIVTDSNVIDETIEEVDEESCCNATVSPISKAITLILAIVCLILVVGLIIVIVLALIDLC